MSEYTQNIIFSHALNNFFLLLSNDILDCNRILDLSVCILWLNSWLLSKSEFYNNGTKTTRIKGICKIPKKKQIKSRYQLSKSLIIFILVVYYKQVHCNIFDFFFLKLHLIWAQKCQVMPEMIIRHSVVYYLIILH